MFECSRVYRHLSLGTLRVPFPKRRLDGHRHYKPSGANLLHRRPLENNNDRRRTCDGRNNIQNLVGRNVFECKDQYSPSKVLSVVSVPHHGTYVSLIVFFFMHLLLRLFVFHVNFFSLVAFTGVQQILSCGSVYLHFSMCCLPNATNGCESNIWLIRPMHVVDAKRRPMFWKVRVSDLRVNFTICILVLFLWKASDSGDSFVVSLT